MELIIEYL